MGTHGRRGVNRWFSAATPRSSPLAPVPVLLVKVPGRKARRRKTKAR